MINIKNEFIEYIKPLMDYIHWFFMLILGGIWQVTSAKNKGVTITFLFLAMVTVASSIVGLILFHTIKYGMLSESWAFIIGAFSFVGSRDLMITYQNNISSIISSILGYIPKFIKAIFESRTGTTVSDNDAPSNDNEHKDAPVEDSNAPVEEVTNG